jgi:hypothetical protein
VLSHRSAAGLWGLRADNRRKSDISLPAPAARAKAAIEVHRSVTLTANDVTSVDGIACTTVARTLVDLGDLVNRRAVESAVEQADVLRLFDLRDVERAIERAGPRRGAGPLLSVLDDLSGPTLTASKLEEAFLAICREAALPAPEVNVWMTLSGRHAGQDRLPLARRAPRRGDGRRPLPSHSAIQRAGREAGPAPAGDGLRARPLHGPPGGEGSRLGEALPQRADRSAATASVPRRW